MHTKIQKWGNSQGLRFPKHVLEEAQIDIGDVLNVFVRDGKIIIEPLNHIKNKYNIKELIAKTKRKIEDIEKTSSNSF